MANDYLYPINMWRLDTFFWWNKPITILKIRLLPNAAADAATFGTYNWNDTVRATMAAKASVISDNHLITSTGNFEATEVVVGDAIWVTACDSTGLAANFGKFLVSSRDSDNAIHTIGDKGSTTHLTNDAAGVYSWVTIAPHIIAQLTSSGTEKCTEEIDFGDGLWVPNFSMYAFSASSVVYVYLK